MILAIVQARLTSSRFAGKVLREVLGKPILAYVFERLALALRIDKSILAVPTGPEHDPLCRAGERLGVEIFRGSEDDVLDRYYQAAKPYAPRLEGVVRITSDCPFIDPALCDRAIEVFLRERVDRVRLGQTFAEGLSVDVFTFQALERTWKEATRACDREHVSYYMTCHPEQFKTIVLENDTDDRCVRITLDRPEDLLVIDAVLKELYPKRGARFTLQEVKAFLESHPEVRRLNAHIPRDEGLQISLAREHGSAEGSRR